MTTEMQNNYKEIQSDYKGLKNDHKERKNTKSPLSRNPEAASEY